MQSERWRTCTEIFHAALERSPNERSTFLAESCAGDDVLRQQVEKLLHYHEEAGDFIASSAAADAPELLAPDPEALIGQQLGNYRIDGVLGVGGMGVVYLAHDERLGRKVGLKILPRTFVNDPAQLERLKLEARTASALNHPNIVTVHEIGQVEETHYIAIEFIEGITLRERIARGPLPPEEAREIAIQVGSALCVAHRAGIVHRDIKPENIMIRPDGYVKVLDFGIAKSTQPEILGGLGSIAYSTQTQLGAVLGTARYMSPEQTRGESIDARSDIWSLGVVLYEMLSAEAPFPGATPAEVKKAIAAQEPRPLEQSTIPSALRKIVEVCLRKTPADRFQTSEELLVNLRADAPEARRQRERKKLFALAATGVLLAAVAFAILNSRWQQKMPAASINKGAQNFALTKPTGLAVDPDGVIYVTDFPNHTIRQITTDGAMKDFAGTRGSLGYNDGPRERARFAYPADIAFGPDRSLYIADCDNHVIRRIAPDGTVSTFAGQPGKSGHVDGPGASALFKYPTGVAVDGGGNVFVADISNHVIRKITASGIVTTFAGAAGERGSADGMGGNARFNEVHGVAVDRAGNVYAADFGNHTIRKITPDGMVTTLAGQPGNPGSSDGPGTSARFCAPYSVAADAAGNVFVADTSNHIIRKIAPDGMVRTVAGVAGNVGSADGPSQIARFAIPAGVSVDGAGNVLVADFGNHAIRKITSAGIVSTTAALSAEDSSERRAPAPEIAAKSIAVLPFADLSPQHDQQYFSDGMAEEILNALAHVKDLKVAGRTSSFSFRGKDADVRSIGATLGVAHVLEGSVRKQENKVRITAQLIQVSDGFHLWSQTYDGDLRDVFSLQERIARAITDQLNAVLNGEQKSRLVKTATTSSEAYALFLQATAIFNRRDSARFRDASAQLQEAVRLDPKFARAHARLASLSSIAPQYDVDLTDDAPAMVAREAQAAMELDPTLAEPHAAVGQTLFTQRRYNEARAAYARALQIDADDFAANFWLGTLLCSTGYSNESARHLDKVLATDPMLPNALLWRGWVHLQLGEIDQAERSIRRASDAGLLSVGLALAHVAQARGERAALIDWLGRGLQPFMTDLPEGSARVIANGTVGDSAARAEAIAVIENYLATGPQVISGAVPLALVWLGQPERALIVAQEKPTRNDTLFLPSLWTASGRNARTLPQFAGFIARTGLAEFWDKAGPPDRCRKKDEGAYVCE